MLRSGLPKGITVTPSYSPKPKQRNPMTVEIFGCELEIGRSLLEEFRYPPASAPVKRNLWGYWVWLKLGRLSVFITREQPEPSTAKLSPSQRTPWGHWEWTRLEVEDCLCCGVGRFSVEASWARRMRVAGKAVASA